jgi:plasmid replication initiation protein
MAEPTGAARQVNFFLATAEDPPLRDNRDVMEYPFLALQKRRTKPIEYRNGHVHVSVAADARFSIATVWDWDVIIGLSAQVNEAVERKLPVTSRIRFVPYHLLKSIGRPTGGKDYRELAQAIRRLRATLVITNVRCEDQPDQSAETGFNWLAGYWIPKRYSARTMTPVTPHGEPDPVRPWGVELSPWLHAAITRRSGILAVHPDYFGLTGGLERWLYRLARKAVPDRTELPAINFRMATLHERSGVTRELKKFAADVRGIATRQPLPEYGLTVARRDSEETVTFWRDPAKPGRPRRGLARRLDEPEAN